MAPGRTQRLLGPRGRESLILSFVSCAQTFYRVDVRPAELGEVLERGCAWHRSTHAFCRTWGQWQTHASGPPAPSHLPHTAAWCSRILPSSWALFSPTGCPWQGRVSLQARQVGRARLLHVVSLPCLRARSFRGERRGPRRWRGAGSPRTHVPCASKGKLSVTRSPWDLGLFVTAAGLSRLIQRLENGASERVRTELSALQG